MFKGDFYFIANSNSLLAWSGFCKAERFSKRSKKNDITKFLSKNEYITENRE
jgi:hypothetical protein